jgi:hypothetical protein
MSKRELRLSNGAADIEAMPAKRRKETENLDPDVSMSDPATAESNVDTRGAKTNGEDETVKVQGLQLWNTIKNAVNKECVHNVQVLI